MILKDFHTKGNNIYLIDKFNNKYRIITSNEVKIYSSKNIDIKESLNTNTRIQLFYEEKNEK